MTNIYLTSAEYDLLRTLGGRPIVKRRYAYPHAGLMFSVDVFEQQLAGLVLAEVELADERAAESVTLPDFAIADVTEEPFFTGGALAKTTTEQLEQALGPWGCSRRRALSP